MPQYFYSEVKVQRGTQKKLNSSDYKTRYKAYRNLASNYTHRKEVRKYFLSNDAQCAICGNKTNLQLDHIVDVYTCASEKVPYRCMNCEKNLRVLCLHCNASLVPGKADATLLLNCNSRW